MGSTCSSVAWSDVDNQYFVLYVPTVGYCVLRYIGWIDKTNWFVRYTLYGLIVWHACFDISNLPSSLSHYAIQFASRLNIWYTCGNKCQLDATEVFIADLIACSTCFGHHYAHHQELTPTPYTPQSGAGKPASCRPEAWPSAPHQTSYLKSHSTKYHRQQPLYNTLELLMMGIVMPETCGASNKICNKNLGCI
jgi:hypothetical protein